MHKPAKGVAHMNHRYSTLKCAVAVSLTVMAVGCQSDSSSHWHFPGLRRSHASQRRQSQSQYAEIQPGYSFDQSPPSEPGGGSGIHPGHSTDTPEQYAPTPVAEPAYPAPPAPVPRADDLPPRHNPDIPGSQAPAPLIDEDVRLKNGPVPPQDGLIRGVGEPDRLSPFSVRSIYEKLRPRTTEPEQIEDGPIANRGGPEATTRVVDFRNASDGRVVGQPVKLGLPETDDIEFSGFSSEYRPAVMQATPSSYRHPMLADPTGMPYGVTN